MVDENSSVPIPGPEALARALLERDSRGAQSPPDLIAAARQTWNKLRSHMEKLYGPAGFEALTGRALSLASTNYPWLKDIQIAGSARGSELPNTLALTTAETMDGLAALLAEFLGILKTLVGVELTTRLVQRAWPDLNVDDSAAGWKE